MNKKGQEKVIIILTIFLFVVLLYFFINSFNLLGLKELQAVSANSNLPEVSEVYKNKNPIDLDEIILKNRNINIREEMTYEEQDLEFTTQYINNEELPTGTMMVSQIGITGKQDVITIKRYNGEELISEKIVANNVRKSPVNKIVEIGTGKRQK